MFNKLKNNILSISFNYPKIIISVFLAISILLISGIQYIVQDDDMVRLLPDDIPSIIAFSDITDEFGNYEFMYIGLGHKNETALNAKLLDIVWDISSEIEELDQCEEVISIATSSKMYFEPLDSSIIVDDLMPNKNLSTSQLNSIIKYLNDNPTLKEKIVSKNEDYLNIVIRPTNNDEYTPLTQAIHSITNKYKSYTINNNEKILEYSYGGQSYVTGSVPSLVASEVKTLVLYGLILMSLVLIINIKNIPAVMLILTIITLSLGSMLGFMGWIYKFTLSESFYFTLNHVSMPIILLTIANSDGVHVISRFFKELRKLKRIKLAITKAMNHLFLPISLTSITTALAFLSLIFSPLTGMNGYGITLAFGICWAWILSLTMLPALISLIKWNPNSKSITKPGLMEKTVVKFGNIVTKYPKKIMSIALSFIAISILGLTLIKVEVNYIKFFRPGNIIRDSAIFLDEHMTGNLNLLINVTSENENAFKNPDNLEKIEELQNYLNNMDVVTSTISINDIIKQLHKTFEGGDQKYYSIPDSREKINNLFFLYQMNDDSDISNLINYENNSTLITSLMKTFSTTQMDKYKIEIENFIKENFNNSGLSFRLSGIMAFLSDFIWLVIKSSAISIGLSISIICLVSSIFFKSWKFGILSVLPLISAIIVNFGLMGLFGVNLTHMTAILSSIIIGVGVDFSIHYTSEYKELLNNKQKNKTKVCINNVGHPILLDALSNMGFASLMMSAIIPMAQIGGLMVFAMFACSFGTLTLLASSIELFKHKL
tara:strand:- start:2520 stop:4838 length:2319 start_codon:yes stop_codon:yes gene_type:complete